LTRLQADVHPNEFRRLGDNFKEISPTDTILTNEATHTETRTISAYAYVDTVISFMDELQSDLIEIIRPLQSDIPLPQQKARAQSVAADQSRGSALGSPPK